MSRRAPHTRAGTGRTERRTSDGARKQRIRVMDQGTRLQDFSAGFADTLRQAMHDVGFEWLSFGLMEYIGEAGKQRGEQRVLYNTNSPVGWEERYLEQRHFEIDPRIALQGDCGLPLAWDMPYLRERVGNSPGDPRVEPSLPIWRASTCTAASCGARHCAIR
ncbi:autoinducer binding domain-containing protein [Ralstonia pickettii]|nr:autoinducer binding domain-containing protein [Ralstonia pickettii]